MIFTCLNGLRQVSGVNITFCDPIYVYVYVYMPSMQLILKEIWMDCLLISIIPTVLQT